MLARRMMVVAAGFLVLGSTPLVVGSTAGAASVTPTISIIGQNSFEANNHFMSTYRFDQSTIKIPQGGLLRFKNKTGDGHTITLVAGPDVPHSAAQVNNCNLCNDVNGVYFSSPDPNAPPAGVQIDNGTITDDSNSDADVRDPSVPPSAPFDALIEDFDTPSHSNANGPSTIGDSTLIGVAAQHQPDARTIQVTAAPGTVLHYFCTFHAWMQGTIVVTKPAT